MALIKVNTRQRLLVVFQERELKNQAAIEARVFHHNKRVFVDFALPYLTWEGHDRRVVEDIIDALKKAGNWAARQKNARAAWGAHSHKPTINSANKVRIPVFARHSEPHVQFERGVDAFVKWSVMGHYFNDDLPAVAAYVAALTGLRDAAFERR